MEGFLSKDAIVGIQDRPFEDVDVPEWGGKVRIKQLSAEEMNSYYNSMLDVKGKDVVQNRENYQSKLLIKCLTDGNGQRLFQDNELLALSAKSGVVINRLHDIASRLNALDQMTNEVLEKN